MSTEKPEKAAPPERKTPLEWYKLGATPPGRVEYKWSTACLAAARQGWDPHCEDQPSLTWEEYQAACEEAGAFLRTVQEGPGCPGGKLPPGATAARVFVLTEPSLMHALVAYKPTPAEAQSIVRMNADPDADPNMRVAHLTAALWDRLLWPAPNSADMQRLSDELPGSVGATYPMAYLNRIGVNAQDVRRRP